MNFQIDVSSARPTPATNLPATADPVPETVELLRQILEVQREQLAYQRAAHDAGARWRGFLARWQKDLPELPDNCRKALPVLERCYAHLIRDLTERLAEDDSLDNDFALQEVLDRYGVRLAQLGTILSLVAPLAEAASGGDNG